MSNSSTTPPAQPNARMHEIPFVGNTAPTTSFSSEAKNKDVAHLIELVDDLRAIATTTNTSNLLVSRFLDAVASRARIFGLVWTEIRNDSEPAIVESRFKNPAMESQAVLSQIADAAKFASASPGAQVFKNEKTRGALITCVPIFKDEQTRAVLCAMVHDDRAKCGEALMVCQAVASYYDLWRSREQLTTMAMEVRSTAMVLELVGKTECSATLKDACLKIANELQSLFRCEYVAVGLKTSNVASCRLMAISSMAEFDHQSRTTRIIRNAFDEAMLRGVYTSYPAQSERQASPALGHKKLSKHMRCEAAITIPLMNQNDELMGAITILGNRDLDRTSSTRNLINALQHPLGSCVEVVRMAEGGFVRKLQRMFVSKEKTKTKWAVCALLLIGALSMMVPIQYRVKSKCTAEPVMRSASVAPHDGLLESTFAEPGDMVTQGQILAKMDGREIGFNISRTVADKNRASAVADSELASGNVSKSIEADLERRGYESQLSVLRYKQDNLEIKSTIDGIVLSGSIDKRENFPVTLGQTLYEVAPISPLRVELAIPADEIMNVSPGQVVKFRFDGFGTETIVGSVERIRPSSTIRDDENVFIAEAILENKDGRVRPGMNGFARIYGDERTLGWSLFHRPWEKIYTAIGF